MSYELSKYSLLTCEQAMDHEVHLAGSILIDPEPVLGDLMTMVPRLKPEDFTMKRCAAIYQAALQLWLDQKTLDHSTIFDEAQKLDPGGEGTLQRFVIECMEATPTAAFCRRYAFGIQQHARARRMDDLAQQLLDAMSVEEKDAILTRMQELNAPETTSGEVKWMDGLRACYQRIGNPQKANYLRWGMSKLDEHLKIRPGGFVILGGFASSGKTALATQLAIQFAQNGHNVCFYSLETDDETIYDRMVAQVSGANFTRIQNRTAVDADYEAIIAAANRTKNINFTFEDAAGWNVDQIRAHALARRFDVILIDYAQLIESSAPNRAEEVARVSRALQRLAKQTKTIVVALSQLTPTDHYPPTMNDLRESRQLTQDADAILILYEPREEGSKETDRVLKIAKNKQGKRGTILLELDTRTMRMEPYIDADSSDIEEEETNSRGFAKPTAPPAREVSV